MQKKKSNLPLPLEITDLQDGVAIDRAATDGCRCEMRITQALGTNGLSWAIRDVTNNPNGMEFGGAGNNCVDSNNQLVPLPSEWRTLNAPSDGVHKFEMVFGSSAYQNFVLKTEVRCWNIDKFGQETLGTLTYHDFDFTEGENLDPNFNIVEVCRKFSCQPLTASEEVNSCLGGVEPNEN